MSRIKSEIYG
jgi:hypothetical protein